MRHPARALIPLPLLAALVLAACGNAGSADQSPTGTPPDEPRHTLTVMVTNQSFEIADAHVAISVDGDEVIDDTFPVKGQHHVVSHEFELPEGEHTIRATSDDGAPAAEWTVDLQDDRWTMLMFWYYPGEHDEPFFDWHTSDELIAIQ